MTSRNLEQEHAERMLKRVRQIVEILEIVEKLLYHGGTKYFRKRWNQNGNDSKTTIQINTSADVVWFMKTVMHDGIQIL